MKKLIIQALKFFAVSGVGWLIDFGVYSLLTYCFDFNIFVANIISSIPAVTYVFIVSVRKIFQKKQSKIKLRWKYLIYIVYQIVLVLSISFLGQELYNLILPIVNIKFVINNLKMIIKICITPITMILNFLVMKLLVEKL